MQVLSKMLNLEDELCCDWVKYYKEMPNLMKYKQRDLKYISAKNKLRVTGNKNVLITRILETYKMNKAACLVQSITRRRMAQSYILLRGPAYKDKKCTNDTDFYTLEPFDNIHIKDFFSFKDNDGFIFGFRLNSIRSLLKRNKNATNPYNRRTISKDIIRNIKRLHLLNKLYYPIENNKVIVATSAIPQPLITLERIRKNKTFVQRVTNLFYEMDQVGNYTSPEWMSKLLKSKLLFFIRYIYNFWNTRAGILTETKNNICPYFNPFNYKGVLTGISDTTSFKELQNVAITICENMFYTAIDTEYKRSSAIYILTSLTVVSKDARESLPWLYESTLLL
jgi:hypothetical protein